MEIKIRFANESDVSKLVELANEWHSFSEKENIRRKQILQATLKEIGHKIFVAETNGQIIGWFDVREYKDWFMLRHSIHIEHIYVCSSYRKQGIGSKILQTIIDFFKNTQEINLVFFYSEGVVDEFFVKNGFKVTKTRFYIREEHDKNV